jgi:hypothetical protein
MEKTYTFTPTRKWTPQGEQRRYVELALSMSGNCLTGTGVDTLKAYTNNLRTIADHLDMLNKYVDKS